MANKFNKAMAEILITSVLLTNSFVPSTFVFAEQGNGMEVSDEIDFGEDSSSDAISDTVDFGDHSSEGGTTDSTGNSPEISNEVDFGEEIVPMNTNPYIQMGEGQVTEGDFVFQTGVYGTTEITGVIIDYKGTKTSVVIPSHIGGQEVKGIGAQAFKQKGLVKVTLPETLEYIGEGAFANNRLTQVHIPDSVTVIEKNAFRENNTPGKETVITGMNGVSALTDGSFAEMYKLKLDIPVLEGINDNAFLPKPSSANPIQSHIYARLYTGGRNVAGLRSKRGLYLIDPATVITTGYAKDSGAILFQKEYLGKAAPSYNSDIDVDNFYTIGCGQRPEYGILQMVDGYARPKEKQDIEIENAENLLEFFYEPFRIQAPLMITADGGLSGKVGGLEGAAVTVQKAKTDKQGTRIRILSWEDMPDYATHTSYGGRFEIAFAEDDLKEGDILKLNAKIDTEQYEGYAKEYYVRVGQQQEQGLSEFEQPEPVVVKQGEKAKLPQKVSGIFGAEKKELKVRWMSVPKTNEAGEYWVKGEVQEPLKDIIFTSNEYVVYIQLIVQSDSSVEDTDKLALSLLIEQAEENWRNTTVSEDGENISTLELWVTSEQKEQFHKQIREAKAVKDNPIATQDQVDAAKERLANQMEEFNKVKQPGRYKETEKKTSKVIISAEVPNLTKEQMKQFALTLQLQGTPSRKIEFDDVKQETVAGYDTPLLPIPLTKFQSVHGSLLHRKDILL